MPTMPVKPQEVSAEQAAQLRRMGYTVSGGDTVHNAYSAAGNSYTPFYVTRGPGGQPITGPIPGIGGGAPGAPGAGGGPFGGDNAEAIAKNEERYAEILKGYNSRFDTAMADLKGSGEQEAADIAKSSQNMYGGQYQNLVDRGLAGTQAAPALAMGVERQKTAEMGRLADRLRQYRIGLQTGLQQDTLQFQERREDEQPDMGQYIQLMQAYGAGGAGQGGGGGGGSASYGYGDGEGGGGPVRWSPREEAMANIGDWHNQRDYGSTPSQGSNYSLDYLAGLSPAQVGVKTGGSSAQGGGYAQPAPQQSMGAVSVPGLQAPAAVRSMAPRSGMVAPAAKITTIKKPMVKSY